MDVNALVKTTLASLGYPVAFLNYSGTATTYITFNYEDDRAIEYADDKPIIDAAYIQVHLFAPGTFDFMSVKRQIRFKLFKAGFTYPTVTSLYETETKTNHVVFQCSISGASESEES
ncbi:MAG: hypothetical protein WC047_04400 [Kiritimatiellales bacterium]